MTKKLVAVIVILFIISVTLCGCIPQPFAEQIISSGSNDKTVSATTDDNEDNPDSIRRLYVSGAVLFDGYIDVPTVCDYKTVLEKAGVVDNSALPFDINKLIDEYTDVYVVDFICDGKTYFSVNVNGGLVSNRLSVDGVSDDIVNRLADYIQANGSITNRLQLMSALGSDYCDNYYKFYIDKSDYAPIS